MECLSPDFILDELLNKPYLTLNNMNFLTKLPHDKALHIIVGIMLYALFHFISPVVGLAVVVLVACGKEVYDYFHKDKHTPEFLDALATIGGGVLACISGLTL